MEEPVRRSLTIVALLTATMLAGACGGTTRPKTAATQTPDAASTPALVRACQATGMSSRKGAEGTCTADGATITVVNLGHEARLRTLGVRLNGCRIAAHGTFARCSLTVRNRSDAPRRFDSAGRTQTMLVIDGTQFFERSDAERRADARSLVARDSHIEPGQSRTGDVVFDLAPRFIHGLRSSGNLFVFNFGDDGNNTEAAAMLHTYR
jgi:hypothetical protein